MGRSGGGSGSSSGGGGRSSSGGGRSFGGGSSGSSGRSFGSSGSGRSTASRSGAKPTASRQSAGKPAGGYGSYGGYGSSHGYSDSHGYGGSKRYGRNRSYGGRSRRRSGCGCGIFAVIALLVVIAIFVIVLYPTMGDGGVTRSTVERQALPKLAVVETPYYTDNLNWIYNETKLLAGMKNYYSKTGVQPYLYLDDGIDGSFDVTDSEAGAFLGTLYDELFSDEAHFLLYFMEKDDSYKAFYLAGSVAKGVMDREACDILLDYLDFYYYESGLTDEEYFSTVFDKTATRIMTVQKSPWPAAIIAVCILAAIAILFMWWRRKKENDRKEAEETERILSEPLETFGDNSLEDIENKYKK